MNASPYQRDIRTVMSLTLLAYAHISFYLDVFILLLSLALHTKSLKELRSCILCIIRMWSLFCAMRNLYKSAFSAYFFGKLVFYLSAFSLFSACSVFRLHHVYIGFRYSVFLL